MRCFKFYGTYLLCAALLAGCATVPAIDSSEANYQEEILDRKSVV